MKPGEFGYGVKTFGIVNSVNSILNRSLAVIHPPVVVTVMKMESNPKSASLGVYVALTAVSLGLNVPDPVLVQITPGEFITSGVSGRLTPDVGPDVITVSGPAFTEGIPVMLSNNVSVRFRQAPVVVSTICAKPEEVSAAPGT